MINRNISRDLIESIPYASALISDRGQSLIILESTRLIKISRWISADKIRFKESEWKNYSEL